MSLKVTVVDEQTGDTDSVVVAQGDYLLICADPCFLHHTQSHGGGSTHVVTIKGRTAPGQTSE